MSDSKDFGPTRLTERQAEELIARAAELDAQLASQSTVEQLRQAAHEAGIDARAFELALVEARAVGSQTAARTDEKGLIALAKRTWRYMNGNRPSPVGDYVVTRFLPGLLISADIMTMRFEHLNGPRLFVLAYLTIWASMGHALALKLEQRWSKGPMPPALLGATTGVLIPLATYWIALAYHFGLGVEPAVASWFGTSFVLTVTGSGASALLRRIRGHASSRQAPPFSDGPMEQVRASVHA